MRTDPRGCEATGPYHLAMCLALQAAGIAVTISNPARIHYFGRSEGVLAKNDPIDAALIERFANAKRPPADPPLCREQLALSEMVNHRRHLVDALKVFRAHRQQVLEAALRSEIERSAAALERRIEAMERRLRQTIEAKPAWKKKLELLTSAKGVGFITALVLLVRMPELGSLNRGQCGALAGLAPYDDDSGTHQGRRSIRGGRSEVRNALYMGCAGRGPIQSGSEDDLSATAQSQKAFQGRDHGSDCAKCSFTSTHCSKSPRKPQQLSGAQTYP